MYGRRNQPVELEPVNPRKRERTPAPREIGNAAEQGFERLSTADTSGNRQPIGGTTVWPPYHEEP